MSEEPEPGSWGTCPQCGELAWWTKLRPIPGGQAGTYKCEEDEMHTGENVAFVR